MASSDLEQIRKQAKTLSESERAELAHDLIETLDGAPDPDSTVAWEQEILLRLGEVQQGTAKTLSRREFSDRLHR